MLWVLSEVGGTDGGGTEVGSSDGDGESFARSPNVSDDTDPAWSLSTPDRQWWALADVGGFPAAGMVTNARLAWSMPTRVSAAKLSLGFHLDGNWLWEELTQPLAGRLALQGQQYVRSMDQAEAYPRFLTGLHDVLVHQRGERVRPGSIAGDQPRSPRPLARGRSTPPPSDWLDVFDRRHDAALSHSAARVKKYVTAQRPFRDRKQQLIQCGINVVRTARVIVPTGSAGSGYYLVTGAADAFSRGFPEIGAVAALSSLVVGVLAGSSVSVCTQGIGALRSRLAESLGLPGSAGPSDHPAVLRRAGYSPGDRGLSAGEHTTTAVSRISRRP